MLAIVVVVTTFATGELMVRLFAPVEYLYPRYEYSPRYGFLLFDDVVMEHGIPGEFRYRYTVNELGFRGRAIEPHASPKTPTIVVLGDSYSFGMGVNDGEEYPWVLQDDLDSTFEVVNLANPGWGLTQQIRRYYDLGMLYHPEIVVLQFCANDPEDNFTNMVTRVKDGHFEFKDTKGGVNWIKKYLSRSIIQKSQLYNFFRGRAHLIVTNALRRRTTAQYNEGESKETSTGELSSEESFYRELLDTFSRELSEDGVRLVFIAVNGQLDRYPGIRDRVVELDHGGQLTYLDVVPWFDPNVNYRSPEGHVWNGEAHSVIASGLARWIRDGHVAR